MANYCRAVTKSPRGTQMYRQMLIIRIEYPQPGRTVPNQKGGQDAIVFICPGSIFMLSCSDYCKNLCFFCCCVQKYTSENLLFQDYVEPGNNVHQRWLDYD